ncbi:hypothetical protein BDY24DRAFT_225208 [Mrakia frigida]|uniref:uncharacterized protein n=1 Tax=Mrakia frigida TaxID=29902 RepID=UPI003FCC1E15
MEADLVLSFSPYLHIYDSSSEKEEILVVNLDGAAGGLVSVVKSPEVEHLLGRKFTFTIFTKSNSYILQSSSDKESAAWISTLDPTQSVASS